METSNDKNKQQNLQNHFTNLPDFDFEEWASLHKSDPEAFEAKRTDWLKTCVTDAPKKYQKRLNGLMFHVNTIRRLEKNPMQTCFKLTSMMMTSLNDMGTFFSDINSTLSNNNEFAQAESTSADILEFIRS